MCFEQKCCNGCTKSNAGTTTQKDIADNWDKQYSYPFASRT